MNKSEFYFFEAKNKGSLIDIGEHMETLRAYASLSDSIIELGVRGIVSTWAFVLGKPKKLTCIDLYHPLYYTEHYNMPYLYDDLVLETTRLGIEFKFIEGNDLEIEIEETDFLFIDTLHTYDQLSKELSKHSGKVKKWIAMHDTETAAGVMDAINDFLAKNDEWVINEIRKNNNGLTILKRIYK